MSTLGSTSELAPALDVRTEDGRTFRFTRAFLIGRDPGCDVPIDNARVSRRHVLVAIENGRWQVHDQQSGNGVLVDGRRVQTAPVGDGLSIRLGPEGPVVRLETVSARPQPTPAHGMPAATAPVGSRTIFFQRTLKRQRHTYQGIVAVVALVAIAAGLYAYRAHRQVVELRGQAQEIFYTMKAQDVLLARAEQRLVTGNLRGDPAIREFLARRRKLERQYDDYLAKLDVYGHELTDQERVILRVTRRLGECEVSAPADYLKEVNLYINRWKATKRFMSAVRRAHDMGYTAKIAEEFDGLDLPRQFFYLAMQESDFNETATGPPTRWGFAKGMWMFIPDTARKYGLTVGPLQKYPKVDPADDRHHWEKATHAAALYIKDLYATDAQASGLLVMASYNWGENRVLKRLRKMPDNPQDRNFWKLLAKYPNDVPPETYNYVLMIVSAAVIGENPRLFGFPLDNPLDLDATRPTETR